MHLWLIPVLPLIGFAVNGLFGRHFSRRLVALVGIVFVAAATVFTWWVAWQYGHQADSVIIERYVTWVQAGNFFAEYGLQLDQLSLLMALIVTGVGFLIHIYSIGYMAEEGGYYRFFSFLNLFMFFMLTLVLANNYLLMFVGWEGVGLASYLLIGFFFLRDSAASAGKKAFIVNRIGDFAFLIGIFLLIKHFGTLRFTEVFSQVSQLPVEAGAGLLTVVGLLLLGGAIGKSAQLPLYVWLPDAMEGPTPVSALIHAATMVTAGVYMIARSHPIYDRAPVALTVVAIIGCATALFAATIGMVQHDIKRVLAYSTISQLGYMVMACGVAAYSAAMFHLLTHAFFKALLFLAAGSVIHALGGIQDMRKMGGLRPHIPGTFWTMTVATFAIAGFPGLSGFFSKDEILWRAWSSHYGSWVLWAVGVFTAFLTAFYMFRLWFLTFFGEFRGSLPHPHEAAGHEEHKHEHRIHESPKVMLIPLILLAVLSFGGGWVGIPEVLGGSNQLEHFLAPVFEGPAATPHEAAAATPAEPTGPSEITLTLTATSAAFLGIAIAWLLYYRRPDLPARLRATFHRAYTALENKYYVDEFYGATIVKPIIAFSSYVLWQGIDGVVIDGTLNESAAAAREVSDSLRHMQSGNIRSYAGWVAIGAAAILIFVIWTGVVR